MNRRRRLAGRAGGKPRHGETRRCHFRPPDKSRPAVIMSRAGAIPLLHPVIVAPVISTIRGRPSEVVIGVEEGPEHPSPAICDHLPR